MPNKISNQPYSNGNPDDRFLCEDNSGDPHLFWNCFLEVVGALILGAIVLRVFVYLGQT